MLLPEVHQSSNTSKHSQQRGTTERQSGFVHAFCANTFSFDIDISVSVQCLLRAGDTLLAVILGFELIISQEVEVFHCRF